MPLLKRFSKAIKYKEDLLRKDINFEMNGKKRLGNGLFGGRKS